MESVENQLRGVVERMRAIRVRKSMSQLELSLRANLSQSFLACVELGKKQPSVLTLLRIANALEVNPALFFSEVELEAENDSRKETKARIIKLIQTL
jgi:transcriptional regulator with XRE-family HTH domain